MKDSRRRICLFSLPCIRMEDSSSYSCFRL